MSWLRIDDATPTNPKIRALNNSEFRVWFRMICACSQHENPTVDPPLIREVEGLTRPLAARFAELGLLDHEQGANPHHYTIHDWQEYRPKDPTAAERMRRFRDGRRYDARYGPDRNETVTRRRIPDPKGLSNGFKTTAATNRPQRFDVGALTRLVASGAIPPGEPLEREIAAAQLSPDDAATLRAMAVADV